MSARQILGPRFQLRRDGSEPAHAQIESRLAERILEGELAPGDRLPAERELADDLGVSRMTVRQALASLATRGLLERGVGRGTFVAQGKHDHDLTRVSGFSEQMRRMGITPGASLRTAGEEPAPLPVADALGIPAEAPAVRVRRIRYGDDVPLALEDSWLPAERFPGFAEHDLTGSLYALMRDHYDLEPARAVERLEPVVAGTEEARALRVAVGAPLMLVERVASTAGDVPVEFARDHYRGDRARFVIHVSPQVLAGG